MKRLVPLLATATVLLSSMQALTDFATPAAEAAGVSLLAAALGGALFIGRRHIARPTPATVPAAPAFARPDDDALQLRPASGG